jgi:phosphoribosyl-ATP pyrophosphohydrolase/phosphoribosyl-AMP cyclohydrolase/histidinol dehydrogenase
MISHGEDGLWPTVVTDEHGIALGLAWSDLESIAVALDTGQGVYHSRSRGLWTKGETSGATQELIAVDVDCDRDALRFKVKQSGTGFCHRETRTCWGPDRGIARLGRRIRAIAERMPRNSNTTRLLADADLLAAKLSEEASELADATRAADITAEAADLIYFALVKAATAGVDVAAIERVLDERELAVTRRPMEAKDATRP